MIRWLAIAFGAVTALALLASLTPAGRTVLGLGPAEIPRAPPAARSPQGGLGVVGKITNILLNLPQLLDHTHVGPAPSPETNPDVRPKSEGPGE